MHNPIDPKQITYDRTTKDYAATFDGELIGYYPNHVAAERALDAYALELLMEGLMHRAIELDGDN